MTTDGVDKSGGNRPPLNDEDVERLLTRFFASEMPASLRACAAERVAAPVPLPTRATPPASSPAPAVVASRRSAGTVGVAVGALSLLAGLWVLSSNAVVPHGSERSADGPLGAAAAVTPSLSESASTRPEEASSGTFRMDRFRMDSEHGPVERRTNERTTNVSEEAPESGPRLETEFPELTIEIVPIREKPRKPASPSDVRPSEGGRATP